MGALSEEISPARSSDLSCLPPVFVTTGACECLRDSQFELVQRLKAAGTSVESHVYPDMPHAFVLANFAATETCPAPEDAVSRAAAFVREPTRVERGSPGEV